MPLVLKEGAETEGLPSITLAGKPYYVAKLRLRERIKIAQATNKVKGLAERFPSKEAVSAGAVFQLSDEDFDVLIGIVKLGLVRLYPSVTVDDLLEEEIDIFELFAASPVIIAQGTSRRASAGEATAASPSTGEGSSPT